MSETDIDLEKVLGLKDSVKKQDYLKSISEGFFRVNH